MKFEYRLKFDNSLWMIKNVETEFYETHGLAGASKTTWITKRCVESRKITMLSINSLAEMTVSELEFYKYFENTENKVSEFYEVKRL